MPKQKKIIVAVSGGFDPPHVGHLRLFEAAKKLGDELVVILNNDNWLRKKKGLVFMPEDERLELIAGLKPVGRVVLSKHGPDPEDMSVNHVLEEVRPDIFANGGDRNRANVPEAEVCGAIGCKMIDNVGPGGKIQSSSWLLAKFKQATDELEKKIRES